MKSRVFALTLSVLFFCVAGSGCSDEAEVRWGPNGKVLDRNVLELRQGASIEAVRSELGWPETQFTGDKETSWHYGPWQLVFIDGRLDRREREHLLVHGPVPAFTKASERRSKAMDGEVLELHPGMSMEAVKARLGMPERYYEVFEDAPAPEMILWYESWELSFIDGKLTVRTKR